MTQMLTERRPKSFYRADILSRMGETVFMPPLEVVRRELRPEKPASIPQARHHEEDPERWDGLS